MKRGLAGGALGLLLALTFGFVSPAAAIRCATPDLAKYRSLIRPVPPDLMHAKHVGSDPMTPPQNPQVGDSWLWWIWHLNGAPWAEQKMCTLRGMGNNVYVMVEDSQWLTRVDQNDVDRVVNNWDSQSYGIHPERGIYQLDTTAFGPPPDELDHDPRIYVLFYQFDVAADGFFWYFDEYPDGSQPYHSNECEVLYISSLTADPGGQYITSVMAHEFQHMIHWLADDDEETWVNEGMSELAMWLYGHPDQITGFPANPDNDLTTFNGQFADYVKVYLWSLYFYEQFGGEATCWDLVHNTLNGIPGFDSTLDQIGSPLSFNDAYANWIVANFIDDTTFDHGEYGYQGTALPAFNAVTKNTYPVPPTNGAVARYAADYVKFVSGTPQRLRFDGADVGTWRPRVIFRNGTTTQQVVDVPLDANDLGTVDLFGFGTTFDTAILVVGKTAPSSATSYQYATEGIPADVAGSSGARYFRLGPGQPNPMQEAGGRIDLELPRGGDALVSVVDAGGRIVRELASGPMDAGVHSLVWDGRDSHGRAVPSGVYYVRAKANEGTVVSRWVRLE
jgi:hypothetical protein